MTNLQNLIGTLRAQSPQQTLQRVLPLLPQIGVTRVANITGLDHIGVQVFTCIRPNAKHLSVSQGKGINAELATISAVMEAFENYHIENPPAAKLVGSYHALAENYPLLDPTQLNSGNFVNHELKDMPLQWSASQELFTQSEVYIPSVLTCIDTTLPQPAYAFLQVSTNGIAAGNILEEALSHGLLEVVERDSLTQWQMLPQPDKQNTLINFATVNDWNADLIEQIIAAEMNIKVWDISTTMEIPAFHCAIEDNNIMRGLGIATGTGAHVMKGIALSRAITEAVQSRLTLISGVRDDIFPSYYRRIKKDSSAAIQARKQTGTKNYTEIGSQKNFSSFNAINYFIMNQLQAREIKQIYFVDHTKPELTIPVAQVFVPGLQFNSRRML